MEPSLSSSEVSQFLIESGFPQLCDIFKEQGILTLNALQVLEEEDLVDFVKCTQMVARMLLRAVKKRNNNNGSSGDNYNYVQRQPSTSTQLVVTSPEIQTQIADLKHIQEIKLKEIELQRLLDQKDSEAKLNELSQKLTHMGEISELKRQLTEVTHKSQIDIITAKHQADLTIAKLECKVELNSRAAVLPKLDDNWVLLMKSGSNETFYYDSPYWTTPNTLNSLDTTSSFVDAKYDSFNTLAVSQIKIVSDGANEVVLQLPRCATLLSFFQSGSCGKLNHMSGSVTPTLLVNSKQFTFYEPEWRINSKSVNGGVRIGGWFFCTWGGEYGKDQSGWKASAELAGVGIHETSWSPYVHSKKSFGIRSAHDFNTNGGNVSLGFQLYGKV